MAYRFGQKSRQELVGVHPSLVAVFERAIELSEQDFAIHDGLRTPEEQRENVRRGVSTTMNSKHLPQSDGFSHAGDAVPWINGKLRWELGPCCKIAAAVRLAAIEKSVRVVWGAVWDRVLNDLPAGADALEHEIELYGARRRKQGKRVFIDAPHFQLEN